MHLEIRKGRGAVGARPASRAARANSCTVSLTMSLTMSFTIVLALAADPLAAQPRGEGPLVLRLPNSARIAAMANAGIASNDGDALLYNPGMLSASRGMAASVQRYGRFGAAGALGMVAQAGSMSVGVGAQFVDWNAPAGVPWPDAIRPGATGLADSGSVAASSSAFTVGVARTIKGLRLGATMKYAEDRIGAESDGTVAFDLGLTMPMGPAGLGITVQNLGAGTRFAGERGTLPRRIGVGWGGGLFPRWEQWDIGAQVQLTVEGDWFVRPAGGAEFGYVPIEGVALVVRSGLRLPRERSESLVTGGVGITVDRISVDYAAEPFRDGRPVAHRVGVRVRP
jgi:hypothetical protein